MPVKLLGDKALLTGTVTDRKSGDTLFNALVQINDSARILDDGKFRYLLDSGRYNLKIINVGNTDFELKNLELKVREHKNLTI